jgi:hypothetical protein
MFLLTHPPSSNALRFATILFFVFHFLNNTVGVDASRRLSCSGKAGRELFDRSRVSLLSAQSLSYKKPLTEKKEMNEATSCCTCATT